MYRLAARAKAKKVLYVLFVACLLAPVNVGRLAAADLIPRRIVTSDSLAGATSVVYSLEFSYASAGTVGSLLVQFCEEGPLPFTPCTPPAGFNASGVSLAGQTGETGFTIYSGSTANEIILTRPPDTVNAGAASDYRLEDLVNPANEGSLFVRVLTFASSDATGPAIDTGGLVLSIHKRPNIQAEVPPFLIFCLGESIVGLNCNSATEPFSDVGILSSLTTGAAQSQMLVATNGVGGYSLWVLGGTMTSGNNTIPALAVGAPSAKGVSQFGINMRANTDPIVGEDTSGPGGAGINPLYGQQNQFRYVSGDTLASTATPDNYRKYTVSYIVNVASNQPGGVYATTLTYVCLANF
jgi:hypothetical protein